MLVATGDNDLARCVSTRLIADFTIDQLTDPAGTAPTPTVISSLTAQATPACQ